MSRGDYHRSQNIKSIVALVLAGGTAGEFQTGNVPNFKALLPVRSRPIADYVIQALEQSNVEKIFVMQDEGAALQESLSPNSKCVFFSKDKDHSSLSMGSLYALERIAEFYGNSELDKRSIMIVPCDTPLVTKDNFNRLINKAASINADVTITIIAAKHLEMRYPQRRFRYVYLSEHKAKYTLQNVIFVNGEFIRYVPSEEPGKLKFSFRGWDKDVLKRVKDGMDSIENLRRQSFFHNKLFFLWLLTKGYTSYIFKLLVDLAFKRLTMARAIEYLNGADHMHSAYIESEEVELSGDIDRPEDFKVVLGIPWQNDAQQPSDPKDASRNTRTLI